MLMLHLISHLGVLQFAALLATCTTPPPSGTVAWVPAPVDTSFVNVQAYGAVGDGVSDDTEAFRAAAATGKQLYVPKPAVAYKVTGYVQLQNSIYGDGTMPEIRMSGATGERAQAMLRIAGYRGDGTLVVQGLTLDGQWDGARNPPKEWSANIDVSNSTHVLIQYNTLENPAGDNVQIGDAVPGIVRDITVRNNKMVNPYRCNVSLEWADGAIIDQNSFNKNNSYVSSIDAEPNSGTTQYVSNFQLTNNVFDAVQARSVALVNGSGVTGTSILVSGNSGHVGSTFTSKGSWTNVTVKDNTWGP